MERISLWRRPRVLIVLGIFALLIWALIFAAWTAFAQPVRPPPEYRSGPVQITVNFVTPDTATRMCRMLNPELPANVVACATDTVMVLPDPCFWRDDNYAEWVCHELGHARARNWEHG